ncbi:MAG: OpgC domain-containing protein [Mesorhizobium sp.]|nr:OpgC domain-containing protein [Mesorhizobium sp.]MBN9241756.1 OpgC domain-containing protein [Mesorhizobium sp.]
MTYPAQIPSLEQNRRDTRIDVLRALALLTIFIDHVPGNTLDTLTYKNFGFSDAAEAFVLISGISVALAYGGKFIAGDWLKPTLKLWRRAGVLYVAHIAVTMAAIALFCFGATVAARPDLLTQINLEPIFTKTPETLIGIVTLGHQLGYNNILPVYAAIMLAAPLALWMAPRRPAATLAVSGAVWLAAGIWQVAPHNYPEPGFWFMNPLSWQFLFFIGLVGAVHVRQGGTIPVRGWAVALAGAYAVFALVWVRTPLWGVVSWFGLPPVLGGFDKTFLSLPRLLHVLAVAYLVISLCSVSSALRWSLDHPLVVLGRRSLPVFIAGTLLAMVAQVLRLLHGGGPFYDASLLIAGTIAQFALAYYLDWQARLGKAQPADARAARQARPAYATVRN